MNKAQLERLVDLAVESRDPDLMAIALRSLLSKINDQAEQVIEGRFATPRGRLTDDIINLLNDRITPMRIREISEALPQHPLSSVYRQIAKLAEIGKVSRVHHGMYQGKRA
jgi:hypothetical protein